MLASARGNLELARVLLQAGARAGDRDASGRTAATMAASGQRADLTRLLEGAGGASAAASVRP
jgi:ankyrin repeat protein